MTLPFSAPIPTPRPIRDEDIVAVETMPSAGPMTGVITDADIVAVEPAVPQITDADIVAVEPTPEPAEMGVVERYLLNPLGRGKNQILDQGVNVAGLLSGAITPEQFADAVLKDMADAEAYPMHPEDQETLERIQRGGQKFDTARRHAERARDESVDPLVRSIHAGLAEANRGGGMDMANAIARNPGAIAGVAVEALPAVPGMLAGGAAGAAAGGAVGGPVGAGVGAAAGTGIASGLTEFGIAMVEFLKEKGVAVDRDTLARAVTDPEIMAEAKEWAAKRGLAIGAFDAITAGLAGRVIKPVGRVVGGGIRGRAAGAGAEAATQAAGGAGGEASAQLATEGQIDTGQVVLEGVAEAPGALVDVPGQVLARRAGEKVAGITDADVVAVEPAPTRQTPESFTPDEPVVAQPSQEPSQATQAQATQAQATQAEPKQPQAEPAQAEPVQASTPDPISPVPGPEAAPVPQTQGSLPVTQNQRTERVVTPDGSIEVDTEFEVVEADSLKAAEGDLQPRDRSSRAASDSQIRNIAARLDPERLLSSRESDRGAPIIDDQNVVLSGNGRVAALIHAAENHPDGFEGYRTRLRQLGYNVEGMRLPVLVRRARNLTPEQKAAFATRTMTRADMEPSPAERARVEKDYISDEMLNAYDADAEAGVLAASNAGFARQFISRVPEGERNAYVDERNNLTPKGADRVMAAIFARAYDNPRLVNRAVEEGKDTGITNALMGAAAAWARMRARADQRFDITNELVDALNVIGSARGKGMTLDNFLAQQDAFDQVPERVQNIARLFYNGNRLAAWRDVRNKLREYAERAERSGDAVGDLLGGGGDTDPDAILRSIAGRGKPDPKNPAPAAAQPEPVPLAAKSVPASDGELFSGAEVLSKGPKRGTSKAPESEGALLDRTGDAEFDAVLDEIDGDEFEGDAVMEDRADSRVARGTMTPGMEQVSFTSRASMFEEIYRAAGIDPDRGVNLPPARQMQVLRQVLQNTFGITVDLNVAGKQIKPIDAINQMMDAYRNVRFMLHTLELPNAALGLGGKLTVALERFKGNYLGAYDPATRTIHMPGRSNSFAHEWAHALDHYLADQLTPKAKQSLFSQAARNEGIDPTQSLNHAFVHLLHTMFFDEADLAATILRLEQKAAQVIKSGPNAGQPTQEALKAQEQIERLQSGATRIRIKPTKFRKDSANFAPSQAGYYASVHEMLARAFEAWVANKVAAAGGSNEFITKGDDAYLSDADARLAMTFPKLDERLKIFSAFEDVFHHIRTQAVLGTGPAAERPADTDIVDPMHWHKQSIGIEDGVLKQIKAEAMAVRNAVRAFGARPADTLKDAASNLAMNAGISARDDVVQKARKSMADYSKGLVYSAVGVLRSINRRNVGRGSTLIDDLIYKLSSNIGTGDARQEGQTYEEEWQRFSKKMAGKIEDALKGLGWKKLKLTDAENDAVRDLMFGKDVPGADQRLVKLAAAFRRIYNDAYKHAEAAGIDMGFVTNKGYLQRQIVTARVQDKPAKFVEDATKVYEVVFDNTFDAITDPNERATAALRLAARVSRSSDWPGGDPLSNPRQDGPFAAEIQALVKARKAASDAIRKAEANPLNAKAGQDAAAAEQQFIDALDELIEAIRTPFGQMSAEQWKENIVLGNSVSYDSHGPLADFTKKRELPSEADDLLKDWYQTDVLSLVTDYAQTAGRRAAYVRRFGNSGGNKEIDVVLRRKEVQHMIQANPRRFDRTTEAGRLNIIRHLANPRTDNILELTLKSAEDFGADGRDLREVRDIIERVTGRAKTSQVSERFDRLSAWIYVYTYVRLLPRMVWTAVAEPTTVLMRTNGNVKAAARTFQQYAMEAFRGAKSTQEAAAFARAIGLVSNQLVDLTMMNRLSGDFDHAVSGNVILANFFRMNGGTQLTNAQRRAAMIGGFYWLQDLARTVKDSETDDIKRGIARAEFRDLGVPDRHIDAMADWLQQSDRHPSLDDLNTPIGQMYAGAISRFVDQTVQDPRRMDKPLAASGPMGRLIYGLTSFLYSFFRNTHMAAWKRSARNFGIAKEHGASTAFATAQAAAPLFSTYAVGFGSIFVAQFLTTVAREALFNPEQWEEKEENEELTEWLMELAFSRTGFWGPADMVNQAITGLRYERDLTALLAGVGPGIIASDIQNVIKGLPWGARNSPNTNTAEHTAWKAVYRGVLAPAMAWGLSSLSPAGPIGWTARHVAAQGLTTAGAASGFADTMAGEKPKKGDGGKKGLFDQGSKKGLFDQNRKGLFDKD